ELTEIRGESHAVWLRLGRSGRVPPTTPEESSKLSTQVSWNKKIQNDARSQRHGWSEHTREQLSAPRDRAHLGMYYATVSRNLKQRANRKCVIARPTQNPVLQPEKPLLISLVIRSNRKSPHSSDSCGGLPVPW